MLVLTRKVGEAIQIGDSVSVVVLEVRGGRVRLGITAPSEVGVHRSEVIIHEEPAFASSRQPSLLAASQRSAFSVAGS